MRDEIVQVDSIVQVDYLYQELKYGRNSGV